MLAQWFIKPDALASSRFLVKIVKMRKIVWIGQQWESLQGYFVVAADVGQRC